MMFYNMQEKWQVLGRVETNELINIKFISDSFDNVLFIYWKFQLFFFVSFPI